MIWKLGNNVSTDEIMPNNGLGLFSGKYDFQIGDIIEAGENFGCGSNRESAVRALIEAGIVEVRAKSFARIFYRNSLNLGLRVVAEKDLAIASEIIEAGGLLNYVRRGGLQ